MKLRDSRRFLIACEDGVKAVKISKTNSIIVVDQDYCKGQRVHSMMKLGNKVMAL